MYEFAFGTKINRLIMKQVASSILMIRPASFGFNAETAANNVFQGTVPLSEREVQEEAVKEFDAFVTTLRSHNIDVLVIEDTPQPVKPDAVFPNNWFCTLEDGTVATFPMYAANRRVEVRPDLIKTLGDKFIVKGTEDWATNDNKNLYLEGTGSMIIDHSNKVIYACLSPRTNQHLLNEFAAVHGYKTVTFYSKDDNGTDVYHTNVIMHLGKGYAVICLSSIRDEKERERVKHSLLSTGHEIVDITMQQVHHYAGNMLQVANNENKLFTVLSRQAFNALTDDQKEQLSKHTQLLPIAIPTIETVGGGSVRCMMAEIFLEKKSN